MSLCATLCLGGLAAADEPGVGPTPPAPFCLGDYAEDFSALSPAARAFEHNPQLGYTYCVRTSAVYECPSYAADGSLRRTQRRVSAHGTAFAYRQQGGETLLLTNQHVSDWPAVTDAEHPVDDVPQGCKRVSDRLRIVDNDSDEYERDDVPLTRVQSDPQLDVAIVKAKVLLPIMPWKVGRSAALRERNVVDVRGFPLGVFKADNVGKVISAYDHDHDKEWDHDDFVIDALLSPGNSGSPVMAISCKTGEPELVGIFHAGYTRGSALNVVVGIDQVRDLMTTLKRTPRRAPDPLALDAAARQRLVASARELAEPFFPFGGLTAAVRARPDDSLVFEIFARDFPFHARPVLVVEDVPRPADGVGELGRVFAGNGEGLKSFTRPELDADAQAQLQKILDGLRNDALMAFTFRASTGDADASRERFDQMTQLERALRRNTTGHQDLSQSASDLADRLTPTDIEAGLSLADVLRSLPQPGPEARPCGNVSEACLESAPPIVAQTQSAAFVTPSTERLALPPVPASVPAAPPRPKTEKTAGEAHREKAG